MNSILVLNDVHIGAVRTAGTTLPSRMAIQDYLQSSLAEIILARLESDLLINGDLFDAFDVEAGQLLACFLTLDGWISAAKKLRGHITTVKLHLVLGNHDVAKNSTKTASFVFLCSLLKNAHPLNVFVYDDGLAKVEECDAGVVWVIPHCVNQDIFDLELAEALLVERPGYLLLHANCDNNFAVESDHSLNVSDEWVRKLIAYGHTLVFAHEHQNRKLHGGKVQILGNQWPTSVADCLSHGEAQKDGTKYAHVIEPTFHEDDGHYSLHLSRFSTWKAEGDYIEMDWRNLEPTEHRFVRVSGTAKSDESSDVINAVHKFRLMSQAFVVTNAVKIDGIAGLEDMKGLTQDNLQSVNVLESLLAELTPPEQAVVKDLLASREP